MKAIFPLALFLALSAQAADVFFPFGTCVGTNGHAMLTILPKNPVVAPDGRFVMADAIQVPATNGMIISNMYAGSYTLRISEAVATQFKLTVPQTNGLVNAANLVQ